MVSLDLKSKRVINLSVSKTFTCIFNEALPLLCILNINDQMFGCIQVGKGNCLKVEIADYV